MTAITKKQEKNFNLHFLVREPKEYPEITKAIVLLHGMGSNEKDMFGLDSNLPDDYLTIFPRAPIPLAEDRYAWFLVGVSNGTRVIDTEQELKSRKLLADFLIDIKRVYGVDELFVGGFSQGGIMSYSIGLIWPELVQGIFALSSRLLPEIKPFVKKDEALKQLPVFIAHGTQDATLPVLYAREARAYLQELEIYPSYHEYEMGHQVTGLELLDLVRWLGQHDASPRSSL